MDFLELWEQMGMAVKSLMVLLALMSMWSVGVFFERLFTFAQAKKQSKLFAPQVAKHLKDGKLKDAIAVSQSKNYKYSHLGKVVLAGLQEYQFQQDTGVQLEKDDVVDSVRRAIQRARGADRRRPQEGDGLARDDRLDRRVRRVARDDAGASSTRSRASPPPGRVVWARSRPESPRRWSAPRSGCSSRFPRCGSTTTSRAGSSTSTSRWTTRRRSWWTTSSRSHSNPTAQRNFRYSRAESIDGELRRIPPWG